MKTVLGTTMTSMSPVKQRNTAVVLAAMLSLAACSSGGSGNGGTTNRAPNASAVAPQSVDEFAAVTLDGSASSDPDAGTTLTYA